MRRIHIDALSQASIRTVRNTIARLALVAAAVSMFASTDVATAQSALPLSQLRLPPGFGIEVVARVPNARGMTWGAENSRGHTLFVGTAAAGKVYALSLPTGKSGKVLLNQIASGLNMPVGVAYRAGSLYVSAVDRILRFDGIDGRLRSPPQPVTVTDALPSDAQHGWKYIAFGPDGNLYVPVGAPCNICEPDSNRYANIMRMKPDGSGLEVFARGVRNSVGFDWNPGTSELWFTDNGRDLLGDDVPSDELNRAPQPGMHFGYPYCHAGTVADPQFGAAHACTEFVPPARLLGAHVAALGMKFYTGRQFPPRYRNQVIIAEHGSWNRTEKSGYRLALVTLDGNRAVGYETFVDGWLQGQNAWGRPVDVLVSPDGSLLVSDDYAGAIYRIRYTGQ